MSDELAASSAADTTIGSDSTATLDSTPAPATEAPTSAEPTAPVTSPDPGPVPYSRFKEVNDQLRQFRDWRQQYAWAESVDPSEFQQFSRWGQSYRTDPVRFFSELASELRQTYPHLAPNLTSEAARILAGSRSLAPEPEIQPDIPVYDEQGRLVKQTYSADAVKQIVNRAIAEAIGKEVAPIKETFAQQQARAKAAEQRQQAEVTIDAIYTRAAKTLPHFAEHDAAIAEAMADYPDASPAEAVYLAWAKVVLPHLDQKSQVKVLADLKTKAVAGTVSPGTQTATSAPKFRSHREALQWFAEHPAEAEAMANSR